MSEFEYSFQESEDSFQEIGLMPSDWISTSDPKLADLTNGDAMTVQLKQFEFELAWATRNEIIKNLNQHTKLLSDQINVDANGQEKMRKANVDLMATLMNLSVLDRPTGYKWSESEQYKSPSELMLDLSSELRSRIVDTLVTNNSIALLNLVPSELKSKLIDRNNELIAELNRLRARTVANSGDSSSSKGVVLIGLAKMNESQASDNAANEKVLGEPNKSDLTAEEVATLKKKIEKLVVRFEAMDEIRNGLEFSFEFNGIDALLAGGPERHSKAFICGGIPWKVKLCHSVLDEVEHLAVYLYHKSITNDGWSVRAAFEMRLLSCESGFLETLSGLPLFRSDEIRFCKEQAFTGSNAFGWPTFITVKELRSGPFIRDDKIKLRLKLFVKGFKEIK